jgi:hypothetical protein
MTLEIGGTVLVSGAVDPAMTVRPIAHRQLEEFISLPVEIRLATHSRAYDDVKPLTAGKPFRAEFGHCSLI